MKVLLVRPPRMKQAITLGEFMYSEPIGLEIVYAMLEQNHQVEILDLMSDTVKMADKLREYKPQVVGITTLCIDAPMVKALAEEVKRYDSNIVTMIGGTQTFLNPEGFFINAVDHVMKYTTTKNITELFDYLEKGINAPIIDGICSRTNNFESTNTLGINEYIHPNRESTAKYRRQYSYFGYKPAAIMGTAQGCSKTCRFCLRWRIEGHSETYFPMEFVIEEIRSIKEDTIMVFDNDFLHNADRIHALCDYLEQQSSKKKFICYASVHSMLANKDMVRRFKRLGLKAVLVGYESFKNEELQTYQKKSTIEDNLEASAFMKSIGLDVWASFMIHPDWTVADFKAFRNYINRLQPETTTFSPLTPFPNLPLYQEYQHRLLADKEEYAKWSFGQVTIMPSKMSLRRYYFEILKTNLNVNLSGKNLSYMIRKFGFVTVLRLLRGSSKLFMRFLMLMVENRSEIRGGKSKMENHSNNSRQYTKQSKEKLKEQLTPLQYKVTQEEGTERAFNNEYWDNKEQGIYVDIVTGEPLFSSIDKYDSGTGWPSFSKPITNDHIVEKEDRRLVFSARTEVRSKHGDSHLGHVFSDGPKPTGLRYCLNSAALRFIRKDDLVKDGYGEYAKLFE